MFVFWFVVLKCSLLWLLLNIFMLFIGVIVGGVLDVLVFVGVSVFLG